MLIGDMVVSNVMCVCDIDVFALICCCGGVCSGAVCFRLSCSRLSRRSCLSCYLRRLCGVDVVVGVVGVFGGVGVGGAAGSAHNSSLSEVCSSEGGCAGSAHMVWLLDCVISRCVSLSLSGPWFA